MLHYSGVDKFADAISKIDRNWSLTFTCWKEYAGEVQQWKGMIDDEVAVKKADFLRKLCDMCVDGVVPTSLVEHLRKVTATPVKGIRVKGGTTNLSSGSINEASIQMMTKEVAIPRKSSLRQCADNSYIITNFILSKCPSL